MTPEEQAVIDAANEWRTAYSEEEAGPHHRLTLAQAVDNYRKATQPPEPFNQTWIVYPDGGKEAIFVDGDNFSDVLLLPGEQIWRCRCVPTTRIR